MTMGVHPYIGLMDIHLQKSQLKKLTHCLRLKEAHDEDKWIRWTRQRNSIKI